ncbi:MAG: hypothetical protein WCA96_12600 [Methylocella sp.]
MTIPILLILIVGVILFFVAPQLAKLRATLGVPAAVSSDATTILQKIWLLTLGLKTPFLNTLALVWSFILAEGDSLKGFAWEQFVSHEHAVWIAMSLWFASLWAHFTGINTAAATPPVIAPLPSAVPAPKA